MSADGTVVAAVASRTSACPLCGSVSPVESDNGLPGIDRCGSCGLLWRRERLSEALYDGDFFDEHGYYTAYFARAAQWRHEARLRLEWLLEACTPSRLLEIGSAGGFFLEAARDAGIDVLGVEPSEDGSEFARSTLQLPVLTSTFEAAPIDGRFDAVCAFHVLEHVPDARGFLAHARELLTPGGVLALEVPNIESARARRDGARWFNLVPEFHAWHFSPTTLTQLVEEAGFVVDRVDTVLPRHYFRARRLLTRSGARALLADARAFPRPRRTDPSAGDYLRLTARLDHR